jgi:dolichol kinase
MSTVLGWLVLVWVRALATVCGGRWGFSFALSLAGPALAYFVCHPLIICFL